MQNIRLINICFSATGTTAKCVNTVAAAMEMAVDKSLNLADRRSRGAIEFSENDIVIVGAPVYGGRIPSLFAEELRKLHGNGARAIAIVVYGNRDYDDALLELTDILRDNGFTVMAAGAFIGQHSIFPKAGMSRPDKADIDKLMEFGRLCKKSAEGTTIPELHIKGNRPYKKYGGVPLHPSGDRNQCKECGVCSDLCPVGAIDPSQPWLTDAGLCITCGRCIVSCPSDVRRYKGIKYEMTGKVFTAAFSRSKEPEYFV